MIPDLLAYVRRKIEKTKDRIEPLRMKLMALEFAERAMYRQHVLEELRDSGVQLGCTVCMYVGTVNKTNAREDRRVLVCDVTHAGFVEVRFFTTKGKPYKYTMPVRYEDLRRL